MSHNELTDEQLMARVARGDDTALELLYDRYAASVMGLALRVVDDRPAAEEIVQETFWRVWQHARSFDGRRGSFTSWLFSIDHRLAIDTVRRSKVRPQPSRNEAEEKKMNRVPDPDAGVAEAAWAKMRRQQVRQAMAELSPEQFRVIELSYFQGLTRQEIAQVTGNPLGTIHTRARLALQKLRKILQQEEVSE